MDSRLIYSVVNSDTLNINWRIKSTNEWIYIGTGSELNKELVLQVIEEVYKNDEKILLVLGRTTSKLITKKDIAVAVLNRIGQISFKLSDLSFSNFIDFAQFDVMRVGKKLIVQ